MTCGLFLILHHVLCVLAIDPGTSTECTETPVCEEPGRYTRRTNQSSRSKTHPAGGQTTSPPTKQDHQLRPRHALVESAERLQTPSAEQSPAPRSSTASKRTRRNPRERHPSANSKDEERPEWPTAG